MSDDPDPVLLEVGRDAPYPVTIREARYGNGVYAGGPWVLVAGLSRPDGDCEAWGSDTECGRFWKGKRNGAEFTTEDYRGFEQTVFAVSGDSPSDVIGAYFEQYPDAKKES